MSGPPPPPEPVDAGGWPPPPVPDPSAAPTAGGPEVTAGPAVGPGGGAGWPVARTAIPPRVPEGLVTALKVLVVLQPIGFAVVALTRILLADGLEDATAVAAGAVETAEITLGLVVVAWGLFIAIPATVCWCVWQSRVHRRVQALRPQATFRQSSGWGVGAWFVPIVSLWIPFQAVADGYRNSAAPGAVGPDGTPPDVGRWWVAFAGVPTALFVLALLIGFGMAVDGQVSEAAIFRIDGFINLMQAASWGAAAVFALRLVTAITGRLRVLERAADDGRL